MSGSKKKKKKEEAKKKWEALALAALTAFGLGMGEGAVKAIPEVFSHDNTPRVVEPLHPRDNQLERWWQGTPEKDDLAPSGGEPKVRFRLTSTSKEGSEHNWLHEASVQRTALTAFQWATFQPKEGDEHLVINAQLHPTSPVYTLNVAKQSIVDHMAALGHPSLTTEDLESIHQITISPDTNPDKPTKS